MMVGEFDSRDTGTGEELWATAWPSVAPTLTGPRQGDRVLVVVAHPDDETLGAGGLIATAAEVGAAVTVVIASDGEASHPESTTLTKAQLAEVRRAEVMLALSHLDPHAQLDLLGLPDSDLAAHVDEIAEHIARYAGETSLLVTTWSGDGHPDHAACADAGARIAQANGIEHWQFPIWAWHWARPDSPELPQATLRRLLIGQAARSAKRRAIKSHRSQHEPLSSAAGDEAILSESMLAHFDREYETFIVEGGVAPASTGEYFDDLYERELDPWKLSERFYEQRKRELLLASLTRERFQRAFEPGCAIGALTVELARRCDRVVAWDGARIAVDETARRVGGESPESQVEVECARIPGAWPTGHFDLIVLSEVGYYCPDLQQLKDRVDASLSDDGVLVACHWRRSAPDHPWTAETVHAALEPGLRSVVVYRDGDFLLDVWTRDGLSVAEAEGIV